MAHSNDCVSSCVAEPKIGLHSEQNGFCFFFLEGNKFKNVRGEAYQIFFLLGAGEIRVSLVCLFWFGLGCTVARFWGENCFGRGGLVV